MTQNTNLQIRLHNRVIGDGEPVFFIAEAGVNHNGSLELAKRLIDAAQAAGADAVKFQTFSTEALSTRGAPKASYHVETTGGDHEQTWFDLLKTQELDRRAHDALVAYCAKVGIMFLSTPYDEASVDLLDALDVPAFKLASTDTTNLPLLRHVARKGRPVLLSTAMCTIAEVRQAVDLLRENGISELVVMQCTGGYPAHLQDSNLRVLLTYRRELECLVGYSDHTLEMVNPIAATALDACVYEKHFTLDRALPGPDHRMSLEPDALRATIEAIRGTQQALGSFEKAVLPVETENRQRLRKSLVAAMDIARGATVTGEMIVAKRPGTGLPPSRHADFIGRKTAVDVTKDTLLNEDMFEPA